VGKEIVVCFFLLLVFLVVGFLFLIGLGCIDWGRVIQKKIEQTQ